MEGLPNIGRDQLEALASRFEVDEVFDKSDAELRGLLDTKAEEYRVYKRRLDELDGRLGQLAEVKAAARQAAAEIDLGGSDSLLRQVDECYSEIVVRAKEARARNALLRGRTTEDYARFVRAAEPWRSLANARTEEAGPE